MIRKDGAFTLIELLVVMALVAIVLAFAVPGMVGMFKGNKITQAAQMIEGRLALARQVAITKNRPVEVRFYSFHDPETPGSDRAFRGMQAFEVSPSNELTPVDKLTVLPASVVMDSKTVYSSLFDEGKKRKQYSGGIPISRVGTEYDYFCMRFRPDGTTDLDSSAGPWFVTIHDELPGAAEKLPDNFATIQIDPFSGSVKTFRPGG
jgi:uncharacterized protein (TIGR02596 family)